ncbi:DUF3551 domain-containing protein [Microbacteriaceae bacterium K1510]|nr:DUF3551 domain-containing protein [Microbacteriaceae bacterium K1510]
MFLRLIWPAFVMLAVLAPSTSHAVEYPWCAQYGAAGDGGRVCGFSTFQQCLETVSGVGGFCERNLLYTGPERQVATSRKHKPK